MSDLLQQIEPRQLSLNRVDKRVLPEGSRGPLRAAPVRTLKQLSRRSGSWPEYGPIVGALEQAAARGQDAHKGAAIRQPLYSARQSEPVDDPISIRLRIL